MKMTNDFSDYPHRKEKSTCHIIFAKFSSLLPQGNVFTPVCHSFHRRGWLPSMHHRPHDSEGLHSGAVCIQEGLQNGGGLHPGGLGRLPPRRQTWGSASGGGVRQIPPPPIYIGYYGIWSTSGRYASYWNAFLLLLCLYVL